MYCNAQHTDTDLKHDMWIAHLTSQQLSGIGTKEAFLFGDRLAHCSKVPRNILKVMPKLVSDSYGMKSAETSEPMTEIVLCSDTENTKIKDSHSPCWKLKQSRGTHYLS